MICTQFFLGHFRACVGDGSLHSEETIKKSLIVPFSAIIIIITEQVEEPVENNIKEENVQLHT